jgi:hypothetical protein
MKTCKTCKHWDSNQPSDHDIYHGNHFPCMHPKALGSLLRTDDGCHGGMPSDFDGSFDCVYTGPDFGCIHHETNEGISQ